jgi:hypothetical protein
MKQKEKPIYRILALFLLISLQLSCSEDNYQDAFNSNNSKSIKKTTINFDEIKNNKKITDKLKDFNDKKRSFKENNRSIYNAEYDFFINTDNIIMAEGDFGTSYTFSIDRNFDYDYIENLVIQITNDNQHVTANVIVYTLTESEKNIVQNGGTISNIVSKTHVYPLDNFIISSITSKIFYEPDHDGSPTIYVLEDGICGVIDHIDDLGDGEVMIYFTPVNCETSGGDGNGDSGAGNSISYDNTSDGNGNPSNYTPGNITYGSGGGGIGVFTSMNPITNSMEHQIVKDFRRQLNTAQITWWTNPNNADAVESISDYLIQVNADEQFAEWTINYFIQHPNTTWQQFENWFMGQSEGQDAFYNDSFWQNTNLNFPQQQLPTWNNFNNSFPRNSDGTFMTGSNNVFGFVGGSVLQARIDNPDTTNNTCALKVSIALNGAGVVIPNIPGQTLQGGGAFAGKYFFLNAKALNNWMKLTFGTNPNNPNHHQFTQSQGSTNGEGFLSALNNLSPNHGIFTMLPISAIEFGASGHCDIFDGTNCATHCYFDSASEINIWILP